MSEYFDCELSAGYYDVLGQPVAQHTFVIAKRGGEQYAFPCFGGFALEPDSNRNYTDRIGGKFSGVVYPAELWSPYMLWSKPQGKALRANLFVALGMARWTTAPQYDYRIQDWYNWWASLPPELRYFSPTCNAGLSYAINGVCQQACNRILWASRQNNFTETPVNWPPSFSASYWVYGYYGKLTEGSAVNLANELVRLAQSQPDMVSFAIGGEDTQALEKASAEASQASLHELRNALQTAPGGAARRQEVVQLLEKAPCGQEVIESHKLNGVLAPDEKFHHLKAELDKQLLRQEVSHDEYAEKINHAFGQMVEEFRNVLPPETFKAMFGDKPATEIIVRSHMPESYEPLQAALRI